MHAQCRKYRKCGKYKDASGLLSRDECMQRVDGLDSCWKAFFSTSPKSSTQVLGTHDVVSFLLEVPLLISEEGEGKF